MKGRYPILFALLLFTVVGCADETLVSDEPTTAGVTSETTVRDHQEPQLIRRAGERAHRSARSASEYDAYAGPLFGLDSAPNGDILVADAGAGIAVLEGDDVQLDFALPGVTAVAAIGRGQVWATVGGDPDPESNSGQALYRVSKGTSRMIADLYAFEATDPDGQGVDSNPYDVASLGGKGALVVDAGGNTLMRVDNRGEVELVATFPNELVSTDNLKSLAGCPESGVDFCNLPAMIPTQAVPTSVAIGPDGYYYVGELKGFPGPVGASSIWKVDPEASGVDCGSSPYCEEVFDGGFTSIVDLAFGPDGRLYVSELDARSWAAVEIFGNVTGGGVQACDVTSGSCESIISGVPFHTAITFDKEGTLWATVLALDPGAAQVVPIL